MISGKTSYLFLITFILACNQTMQQSQDNLKTDIIIPYENIEGCDVGSSRCDTIHVNRHSKTNNINLVFPHGGTQAQLLLYDRESYLKMMKSTVEVANPLCTDNTNVEDIGKLPTISLSGLEDGIYCVHMVADAYGGFKWVNIKTEK